MTKENNRRLRVIIPYLFIPRLEKHIVDLILAQCSHTTVIGRMKVPAFLVALSLMFLVFLCV